MSSALDVRSLLLPLGAAVLLFAPGIAAGQIPENPEDPTGIAIPHRRVRLLHSTDPSQLGTSAHLQSRDPFLLYQTGRDLLHRQFQLEHGIYGQAAALSVPLYVGLPRQETVHGVSARFARDHASSCGMCHSSVYREPSAGQTIASTGGRGRNTPHFYGSGVIEMIGERVRTAILAQYDTDGDGLIGRAEAAGPRPVRIRPAPGAPEVDYGDLAPDAHGVPQLNCVFRVWYVDAKGRVVPDAVGMDDPRVDAYGFAMLPFGWGRGRVKLGDRSLCQGGEAATGREFYSVAADFHLGLQSYDPTQLPASRPPTGLGGLARRSLPGAQQFDFGGSPDLGRKRSDSGISLDDPDRDGTLNELTEGDLDAIEFYLLHTPLPAVRSSAGGEAGRKLLARVGCTRCHVDSWRLPGKDEGLGSGDRRLFHLATTTETDEEGVAQIVGTLVRLDRVDSDGSHVPAGQPFLVEGVFSDFKHWDIGPDFWERRFDGSLQREHRTAPLWGVGSTAPFGHAGQHLTLEAAITAHGGAAEAEAEAFAALEPDERETLIDYLRSLVLYPTDEIPVDIDGDGQRSEEFEVAGQEVGYERFDARFLFKTPPRYKHVHWAVHYTGRVVPFRLIENVDAAYGLDLPYRIDSDNDGFPDILQPTQKAKGAPDEQPAR